MPKGWFVTCQAVAVITDFPTAALGEFKSVEAPAGALTSCEQLVQTVEIHATKILQVGTYRIEGALATRGQRSADVAILRRDIQRGS